MRRNRNSPKLKPTPGISESTASGPVGNLCEAAARFAIVADSRDAENALPPILFGTATAFMAAGTMLPGVIRFQVRIQIVVQVRFEVLDPLLVPAGGARVGFRPQSPLVRPAPLELEQRNSHIGNSCRTRALSSSNSVLDRPQKVRLVEDITSNAT